MEPEPGAGAGSGAGSRIRSREPEPEPAASTGAGAGASQDWTGSTTLMKRILNTFTVSPYAALIYKKLRQLIIRL